MRHRGNLYAVVACLMAAGSLSHAKTFKSSKGYSITPAAGWEQKSSAVVSTDVVFVARPSNGFASNLNVVVTQTGPRETLQNGLSQINAMYPRMFTGYKRLEQGTTTVGGTKAAYNTANYTTGTPARKLRMRQVFALRKGFLYTFTCTSLDAQYAKDAAAFNTMLKSVRWH